LGYTAYVKNNIQAKRCLKMTAALALLPHQEIERGYQEVKFMPKPTMCRCLDFLLTFQGKI